MCSAPLSSACLHPHIQQGAAAFRPAPCSRFLSACHIHNLKMPAPNFPIFSWGNPPPISFIIITRPSERLYLNNQKRGFCPMITYEPFWNTLRNSGESTYTLIRFHKFSSATIERLRKNRPLNTTTLNDLCRILNCSISDILEYRPSSRDQIL